MRKYLYFIGQALLPFVLLAFMFCPDEPFSIGDCVYRHVLGLYCFGCGGTRALFYLLHGELLKSVFYHPFVLYVFVVYVLFMLFPKKVDFHVAILCGAFIVLVQGILKNILLIKFGVNFW